MFSITQQASVLVNANNFHPSQIFVGKSAAYHMTYQSASLLCHTTQYDCNNFYVIDLCNQWVLYYQTFNGCNLFRSKLQQVTTTKFSVTQQASVLVNAYNFHPSQIFVAKGATYHMTYHDNAARLLSYKTICDCNNFYVIGPCNQQILYYQTFCRFCLFCNVASQRVFHCQTPPTQSTANAPAYYAKDHTTTITNFIVQASVALTVKLFTVLIYFELQ